MTRMKSAIIVFLFLAISITVAVSIDYTDTYVADRFHKALRTEQFEVGSPISLDRFIEYYDWDEVHVIAPGATLPDLKTQFGLPFNHTRDDDGVWSLIFVKSYYVVAEIHIQDSVLGYPLDVPTNHFDRWAAIIEILDDGEGKRMAFVGE
ncbi:hypothetical protein OAN24_05575 [Pseudodesulfovibrio sp.]|nr:hypothetical protein [Pseudodesulfovibrio sp.]